MSLPWALPAAEPVAAQAAGCISQARQLETTGLYPLAVSEAED